MTLVWLVNMGATEAWKPGDLFSECPDQGQAQNATEKNLLEVVKATLYI